MRTTAIERQWSAFWNALSTTSPDGELASLVQRYSESHRAYHTLQHIDECLAHTDTFDVSDTHRACLGIAIWYHDAVYHTDRSDNEERSAELAKQALTAHGVSADTVRCVVEAILATRHDANPRTAIEAMMVDIDLAILAAPPQRYMEYEMQIRSEYIAVPEATFRTGRSEILARFLSRPTIYTTLEFRELETMARKNLRESIRRLVA